MSRFFAYDIASWYQMYSFLAFCLQNRSPNKKTYIHGFCTPSIDGNNHLNTFEYEEENLFVQLRNIEPNDLSYLPRATSAISNSWSMLSRRRRRSKDDSLWLCHHTYMKPWDCPINRALIKQITHTGTFEEGLGSYLSETTRDDWKRLKKFGVGSYPAVRMSIKSILGSKIFSDINFRPMLEAGSEFLHDAIRLIAKIDEDIGLFSTTKNSIQGTTILFSSPIPRLLGKHPNFYLRELRNVVSKFCDPETCLVKLHPLEQDWANFYNENGFHILDTDAPAEHILWHLAPNRILTVKSGVQHIAENIFGINSSCLYQECGREEFQKFYL